MRRALIVAVAIALAVVAGVIAERGRRLDAEILEVAGEMQHNIDYLQSETDNLIVAHRSIPGVVPAGENLTAELAEAGLLLEEGRRAVQSVRWLPQVSQQRAIGNIHDSLEIQKRVTGKLQQLAEYLGEKLAVPDQGRTIAI